MTSPRTKFHTPSCKVMLPLWNRKQKETFTSHFSFFILHFTKISP